MQAVLYCVFNSIVEIYVDLMPGFHHVQARAFFSSFTQRRSRSHAERLGFVAGGNANRGVDIKRDHNRGLAAKLRLDLLLHGSEVRVHVQEEPVNLLGGLSGRHEGNNVTQKENKRRKIKYSSKLSSPYSKGISTSAKLPGVAALTAATTCEI